VKPYLQLLALLALALAGALAWGALSADPGYLLVSIAGWSVESTVVGALLLLIAAALLLRLLFALLRAPFRLWRRRRRTRARERLAGGVLALHEGRWKRADTLLRQAAGERSQQTAALLLAAQAAQQQGDRERQLALLGRLADADSASVRLIVDAEALLRDGRPAVANELLEAAAQSAALPPRALELRVQGLQAAGRAAEALALLPELRRSRVREGAALEALERTVAAAALQQAANPGERELVWNALARGLRVHPAVLAAYVRACRRQGSDDAGAAAIEAALGKHWDDDIAALYGQLAHGAPRSAIKRAEAWLAAHPASSGMLLALGQLCRREQLWGKAEEFLQRALAGRPAEAWEGLGELYIDRGDHGRAQQALRNALLAGRGEPTAPLRALLGHEREQPALEARTSMGLPRLADD
jgi:HemY protein